MNARLDRLGPLAGVLAAVLGIAGFGTARTGPGASSSGAAIIDFYVKHAGSQRIADTLLMLSGASLVLFAAFVCQRLGEGRGDPFSTAALAGAAVIAAGVAVYFGADYTLASDPGHLDPAAAQALNSLGLDLFFPVSAGGLIFGVTAGVAILRSGRLPGWLGVVAILIGVISATPLTLAGLFALLVWSAITGLVLWSRSRGTVSEPAVGPIADPR